MDTYTNPKNGWKNLSYIMIGINILVIGLTLNLMLEVQRLRASIPSFQPPMTISRTESKPQIEKSQNQGAIDKEAKQDTIPATKLPKLPPLTIDPLDKGEVDPIQADIQLGRKCLHECHLNNVRNNAIILLALTDSIPPSLINSRLGMPEIYKYVAREAYLGCLDGDYSNNAKILANCVRIQGVPLIKVDPHLRESDLDKYLIIAGEPVSNAVVDQKTPTAIESEEIPGSNAPTAISVDLTESPLLDKWITDYYDLLGQRRPIPLEEFLADPDKALGLETFTSQDGSPPLRE